MSHSMRKINHRESVYRGLVIRKVCRSALNPITRYRVLDVGYSYGLFDTVTDARQYIDKLVGNYYEKFKLRKNNHEKT